MSTGSTPYAIWAARPVLPAGTRGKRAQRLLLAFFLGTLLASGCATEVVHRGIPDLNQTPYETYRASLHASGLNETAIGKSWIDAGESALQTPIPVHPPFREVGYMNPADVSARSYEVQVRQGQRLSVHVALQSADTFQVFVDLFEASRDTSNATRHVAIADSMLVLEVEAKDDLTYLVRLQPELLRGGRYTVDIALDATLGFPVAGKSASAIHSPFGVPRDGGRRSHKGVDIFARKGTPVVAISDGYIVRSQTTPIGGKVVWVRDAKRNQTYYYAHLDENYAIANTRVQAGDTLGTVGTTGNARNTPPHLHFGIYTSYEAVDPEPFIRAAREIGQYAAIDESREDRLGQWVRVNAEIARLRTAPYRRANLEETLPRYTALRVMAVTGDWYHVALPDGDSGFILATLTEDTRNPVRNIQLAASMPVHYQPNRNAVAIDSIMVGSEVPVFGEFGNFVGITAPSGQTGWVAMD